MLPREHLRWLLSLDLSSPVKNVKRDFSNGYLVAEVLSRYHAEVPMHSFDPAASSVERKRDNWAVLEKLCKKLGFSVSKAEAEALVACEPDAALPLLARLHAFLVGAERGRGAEPAPARERGRSRQRRASPSPTRQLHHVQPPERAPSPAAAPAGGAAAAEEASPREPGGSAARGSWSAQQQAPPSSAAPFVTHAESLTRRFSALQADYAAASAPPARDASPPAAAAALLDWALPSAPAAEAAARAPPRAPHAASASPPRAPRRRRLPSPDALSAAAAAASASASASLVSWGVPAAPAAPPRRAPEPRRLPETRVEWSRASDGGRAPMPMPPPPRRRVDYVPYTQADYEHLAGARAYWQLGTLGPDLEREELAAKRLARARALQFASAANAANVVELAGRAPPAPRPPPETARLRAKSFAALTFAPGGGLLASEGAARSPSPAREPPGAVAWKPSGSGGGGRRRSPEAGARAA